MNRRKWLSKWLILPVILITMISTFVAGRTWALFNDSETSTGNTSTAWTSTLWTQTSQTEFENGVLTNVDTTTSPGDVTLTAPETSYPPASHTGNWTNGANGYSTDNAYATYTPSTTVSTRNPTANTGGMWTNPTRAYTDGGTGYANITSGNPSGSNIWGNYGFSLTGDIITQVRVRYDAWSDGAMNNTSNNPTANTNGTNPWTNPANGYTSDNSYATAVHAITTSSKASPTGDGDTSGTKSMKQFRVPTGIGDTLGTWVASSGTTFYDLVDECSFMNVAASTTNYITSTTTANNYYYFTFPAFSIPASATVNSVTVYYYIRDNTLGANSASKAIKVGGSYYSNGVDNPGTTATWYSYSWTTNPKSAAAWTPAEVNGTDATNPLQQFGMTGADLNPAFRLCSIFAEVDFTYASNYYAAVDEAAVDYQDPVIAFTAAAGSSYNEFTFPAFSVPTAAQNITLRISYMGAEFATAISANNVRAGLKVNNTLYNTTDAGSNPGLTPAAYTYTFTVNPNTTLAWTAADINGSGAAPLTQFGIATSDSLNPVLFYYVWAEVLYYLPHDQIYGTFGFTGSDTITTVEVGYEAFATATQKLNLYTSANGGGAWSSAHLTANLATSDPNAYTYIDVTADQTWDWTKLNDSNFKVKIVSNWVNGTPTWSVDALIVRVTCATVYYDDQIKVDVSWNGGTNWSSTQNTTLTSTEATYWYDVTAATTWTPANLANGQLQVRALAQSVNTAEIVNLDWLPVEVTYYDTTMWSHTYGAYGISLTGDYIIKVEAGFEAFAASSEEVQLDVTWNNGTSWSSKQTSSALLSFDPGSTTWFDFTADTAWTPTKLNNTNFKVRIWYLNNGAYGQVSLDYIPVRVTYRLPSGTIDSAVWDTTVTGSGWDGLVWDTTLPGGTSITIYVRAQDASFLKTAGSPSWTSVGSTSPVISGLTAGRYKQWRATLTTSNTSTPTLSEVRLYYDGG